MPPIDGERCFYCGKPAEYPGAWIPGESTPFYLHHACIWPFIKHVMEYLLRLEGEHPEDLDEKRRKEKDDNEG